MTEINLTDKRIGVLGLGKSGIALARVLTERGAQVLISDSKTKEQLADMIRELDGVNVELETGGHTSRLYDGMDLVVISPGASINLPILQDAFIAGVSVISEVEMAYLLAKAPFIAITGTNGKSTTTTLTHETLLAAGKESYLAGNIGIPLVGEVGAIPEHAWITSEISSFQLEAVDKFHPRIGAILNVTTDHIDRHNTITEYALVKARLFMRQNAYDFAVLNADDELIMDVTTHILSHALYFSTEKEVEEGAFLREGNIITRFNGVERVFFPISEIPLRGKHNLKNVLAVACICLATGVEPEYLIKAMKNFKPLHYRMEYVDTINGVSFYNDSKGTNPDAVRASLESFTEPLSLIAGGTDKNLDFSELAVNIRERALWTVLIGESRFKIADSLKAVGYHNYTIFDDMSLPGFKESIRLAMEKTPVGGVVLLSPSCASFDMFKRAEHRGEMFDQYVRELKKEYEKEV